MFCPNALEPSCRLSEGLHFGQRFTHNLPDSWKNDVPESTKVKAEVCTLLSGQMEQIQIESLEKRSFSLDVFSVMLLRIQHTGIEECWTMKTYNVCLLENNPHFMLTWFLGFRKTYGTTWHAKLSGTHNQPLGYILAIKQSHIVKEGSTVE